MFIIIIVILNFKNFFNNCKYFYIMQNVFCLIFKFWNNNGNIGYIDIQECFSIDRDLKFFLNYDIFQLNYDFSQNLKFIVKIQKGI